MRVRAFDSAITGEKMVRIDTDPDDRCPNMKLYLTMGEAAELISKLLVVNMTKVRKIIWFTISEDGNEITVQVDDGGSPMKMHRAEYNARFVPPERSPWNIETIGSLRTPGIPDIGSLRCHG